MTIAGRQVTLVPVAAEHVDELRRIRRTPEVAFRWYDVEAEPDWPFDEEGVTCFTIVYEGRVAGLVQYYEENEPHYRHAGIDILVDPAVHGRGIGRDAVGALARHLIEERGHHRLVIDPAADNEAAIRCYAAVGFKPVGILRQQEQDADGNGWHDALLMDLLAEELIAPGPATRS
jgi:RimJ/RimL family protein N-acetyltransferase